MTWITISPQNLPAYQQKLACMDITAFRDQVLKTLKDSDVPLSTGEIRRGLPKVKGYWIRGAHSCPTCTCEDADHSVTFKSFFHDGVHEDANRVRSFMLQLEREGKVEVFRPGVSGQAFSYRWIGGDEDGS